MNNKMNNFIPATGALKSPKDKRTIKHKHLKTLAALPVLKGGIDYLPADIENQVKVGICTAISLTQNASKAIGKKFSADFQYLLQKKYYDLTWIEGSSIFHALKVGKNYGFLPAELWTWTTEADRELSYDQYIEKLKAVSDSEIQRLIALCSDYKLDGYAQVQTDSTSISNAIVSSKSGILCRYVVGQEWWTASDGRFSWATADINPLRPPKTVISGHAITMNKYDFTINVDVSLANTWGANWNKQGSANVIMNMYSPTEAWIPYYGLEEHQIEDLKNQLLKQKLTLMQKIVALLQQLLNLKK